VGWGSNPLQAIWGLMFSIDILIVSIFEEFYINVEIVG
jgi:hypothetical protein